MNLKIFLFVDLIEGFKIIIINKLKHSFTNTLSYKYSEDIFERIMQRREFFLFKLVVQVSKQFKFTKRLLNKSQSTKSDAGITG